MTDQPRDFPLAILTDFAPVPREQNRRDGWGPEVQRAFIAALADCGSVRQACRFVGRSAASAYRLRRHPDGAGFAEAWRAAIGLAIQQIEDFALDRAVNGVEVPVFAYGDRIASRTVHNEQLVMFMLRNLAPERYCEGGAKALTAVDKRVLARLEKEWRARWDEEQRLRDDEEEKEAHAEIDDFIERMARNRRANMSPAQRRHEIAAAAQSLADKAAGWGPGMPYGEFAEEAAALLPQFVAEVEAEWPPLPDWAWEAPEEEDEDEPMPLPPPRAERRDEPEPPPGPRIRTLKDKGW